MRKIITGIFFLSFLFSTNVFSQFFFNEHTFKLGKLLHCIENFYVDTVNMDKIVEQAVVKMLKDLDPHSTYIPAKDVKEMNESLQGNFQGIGITFNILNDTVYVISTISGGPSEKVGIMAGDRIIRVNDELIAGIGISNKGVRSRLLGDKGTIVNVSILRRGSKKLLDFTIIRDDIPIYSIDASYMLNDSIGYIKVNRFARTTISEFLEAMEKLRSRNMKHLVLDLSGNGGGYLEIAVQLVDQFFSYNKIIVYTEGEKSPRYDYTTTAFGAFQKGNLAVVIDEGSASASEIVTGAIQDWDRGVVVGRRSFGKGLVQRPFMLPDSSMIRLTIARYYTPTGRLIQKPYEGGYDEYSKDIIKRYNSGELLHEDSIHFPDSLKYYTLMNKRVVYGGGGIMPDYFIPLDTNEYTDYNKKLINRGIINQYVLQYVDKNRKRIMNEYPTFADYHENYRFSDEDYAELIAFATKKEIEKQEEQVVSSKEKISLLVKAYVARDIWESSEFYEVINEEDPSIQKALEILKDQKLYHAKLHPAVK